MGMRLEICTLSDENIQKVLDDPPLIWKVLSPDDPEPYEREIASRSSSGFFSRLFNRKQAESIVPAELHLAEGEVTETDLDKAWHGIHYLLTGTAWEGEPPLNFLVSGGTEVGDVEVGYGPARVFDSERVRAVDAMLRKIDEATLRGQFNPQRMMELEIYPEIWDRDPAEDDTFQYCAEWFSTLKAFVSDAARRGSGLVIYLA